MPSPFEGMGKILAGALGAPVVYRPAGGAATQKVWHVREYPEDILGGDRPVQSAMGELRVPRSDAVAIAAGDAIETENGDRYLIGARVPTPNPAGDALVTFEIQRI